jgi:hypothetical protein
MDTAAISIVLNRYKQSTNWLLHLVNQKNCRKFNFDDVNAYGYIINGFLAKNISISFDLKEMR